MSMAPLSTFDRSVLGEEQHRAERPGVERQTVEREHADLAVGRHRGCGVARSEVEADGGADTLSVYAFGSQSSTLFSSGSITQAKMPLVFVVRALVGGNAGRPSALTFA